MLRSDPRSARPGARRVLRSDPRSARPGARRVRHVCGALTRTGAPHPVLLCGTRPACSRPEGLPARARARLPLAEVGRAVRAAVRRARRLVRPHAQRAALPRAGVCVHLRAPPAAVGRRRARPAGRTAAPGPASKVRAVHAAGSGRQQGHARRRRGRAPARSSPPARLRPAPRRCTQSWRRSR